MCGKANNFKCFTNSKSTPYQWYKTLRVIDLLNEPYFAANEPAWAAFLNVKPISQQ